MAFSTPLPVRSVAKCSCANASNAALKVLVCRRDVSRLAASALSLGSIALPDVLTPLTGDPAGRGEGHSRIVADRPDYRAAGVAWIAGDENEALVPLVSDANAEAADLGVPLDRSLAGRRGFQRLDVAIGEIAFVPPRCRHRKAP